MKFLDFVHIFATSGNNVVVEYVSIGESSQFRAWKFSILAEIESMDGDADYVNNPRGEKRPCNRHF